MKHYLRFILVLLLSTVWCVGGYAQKTATQSVFTGTSADNVGGDKNLSFSCAKGGGTADPNISSNCIQLYQIASGKKYGNTLTVKSVDGYKINSIEIGTSKASSISYTLDSETTLSEKVDVDADKTFSINSLDASSVTFYCMGKAKANRFLVNKLTITYSQDMSGNKTATTLTFPQESFSFATIDDLTSFKGQTATLKVGEAELAGQTITYTKSGNNIFTSFDEKTGALVLNGNAGTATVTAKFAGNDEYASSSGSYTITVRKVYGDIADLKKVLTTTAKEYSLNLKDAVVTGIYDNKDKNGNFNVYIEDASAGILIFYPNANNDFKVGQKINGEVTIKGTTYNSLPEITSWTATESCTVVDGADVPLTTVTIAELSANFDKYESRRVKIENATVTTGTATDNESGKIAQGESEMTLRTKAVAVTTTKDDVIDVIGYPATYRSYQQFSVWSQDDVIVKSSVVKTTLSFDPATTEYNIDNNNKDAFTAPTATVKDAEGNVVEGAAITYTSSKPGVATVGETDGQVTFVGFGTTVITASYAGDAPHMASKNSYTINYGKVKTTMAWSAPAATANLGETSFDAPTLTLKAGDVDILDGKTITYSSSVTDVAEISTKGTVTIHAEGTTVITATFAGDDTYAEASAEYTLTVKDPNKLEVTFDFMKPDKYDYGVTSGSPVYGEGKGDVLENATLTEGIVTLKNTTYSGSGTRFYSDGLRTYTDNEHTLYVPAGYRMTSISFSFGNNNTKMNYTIGSAAQNTNWTGEARKVIIKYTGTNKPIESLTVAYKKIELSPLTLTLNEDDNDIAISENGNTYANVTATRSMIADGGWYTFCVPFDIEDVATTPLKDAEIRKYKSMTGSIMNFEPTTSLKAMHAYLVKPTSNIVNPEFEDVLVVGESDKVTDGENGFEFVGICSKHTLALNGTNLFLGANNTFYIPTPEDCTLKALRGYFVVPEGTSASKMGINIDGETTSISALNTTDAINGKVYNLNGQYVGNDVKSLKKGVYVVNGRKFIVK